MGLGVGIFLIAVGAIVAFAVGYGTRRRIYTSTKVPRQGPAGPPY
jgi:hypothetical protein